MSQIQILTRSRRRAFEGIPKLNLNERICFFNIDTNTRKIIRSFRTPENRLGFIVQRAYFQAKGRFFDIKKFQQKDIKHAKKELGLKGSLDLSLYSYKSAERHKALILEAYGWKPYTEITRLELEQHSLLLVDKQKRSEDVLFGLLAFCWKNRTEIPSYAELSDIVSRSYTDYESSILIKVKKLMTESQKTSLLNLLDNPPFSQRFGDLKRIDQSDNEKSLVKNAETLEYFRDLFFEIQPIIEGLNATEEATQYFSDWVYSSDVSQIKQLRNSDKKCLHLAAFVRDQFFKRQDFAVDAIIKKIRSTVNKANGEQRKHNEQLNEDNLIVHQSVTNTAKTTRAILNQILVISKNESISPSQCKEQIVHLVEAYFESENPDLTERIQRSEVEIQKGRNHHKYYYSIFNKYLGLQKSLGPLVRALTFDESSSDENLLKAISHYKSNIIKIDKNTPLAHLKEREKQLVLSEDSIPVISKYKTMLFIAIEQCFKNRTLTLEHSYRYRNSNTYLIPLELWNKNKAEYIAAANLMDYSTGKDVLLNIGKNLTSLYQVLDKEISSGLCPDCVFH